ncbi:zinc finger protein 324A-like isoform X2 [Stegodyphus dumicola]|uniref:zinc finger protein 324A-like isoform X2 n=1 Tax=Stegodyphus dumicola TaxID=202533 RepID=UPI0015ABF45A|nr:zinc finger protein 324A-like isoform X2 [Stegodyphus dumicola]
MDNSNGGSAKKMASTPEQVVCTPTFVFPTTFPVNGFQLWKDDQKDVLTLCNSSAPWPDYRGFDPRSHLANFHVAAAVSQSQPLQHPDDSSKQKGGNRGGIKNHLSNQNDFSATRNLLVAAASAPPAFPGIDSGLKIPNPNLDKQSQQQQPQPPPPQQQQQQPQPQQQQQQQQNQQQHPQHHHQPHDDNNLGEKERSWPCPSCKVPFKQASELQAHLSAHTKGEKTVPCDICGKYFASGDRVRIHVKAAHGEKSCSCEICGSGFSYRCKLLDHMRTHTGDKPFHCEVCGKSFSQKNHLTRHSMIHTGERPYPCDFCGRGFYRKDKLTRHRRIHTVAQGAARHSRGMGHHGSTSSQNNNGPNNASANANAIKMEPAMPEPNPSTTSSTSLSFAPSTLTPTISTSHYRASPYKPEWPNPPSGVH